MAYSTQSVVSDGTLSVLDVAFEFYSHDEITVWFDNVPDDTSWEWSGVQVNRILFDNPVPNGVEVFVFRTTYLADPLHVFATGAAFRAQTVDENFEQILRVAQEYQDRTGAGQFRVDLDMTGHKITNLGDAVADDDAPTYGQAKAYADAQVANLDASVEARLGYVLRAPEFMNPLPNVAGRAAKLLAFDANGHPVTTIPSSDSAQQLRLDLLASNGPTNLGFLFGGTGTRARTLDSKIKDRLSVADFGYIGDGTLHPLSERYATLGAAQVDYPHAIALTDSIDWAAIQGASDYCAANGYYLDGVKGTSIINRRLNLKCSGDLGMMIINVVGATLGTDAIVVGLMTGSTFTSKIRLILPELVNTSKSGANWATAGTFAGISCANLYHSVITFSRVYGFVVGADIGGWTWGNGLNTYHLKGSVEDNMVGCRLMPRSHAAWCNDNLFIGWNIRINSANTGVVGTRNIQIIPFDLTTLTDSWPNNNVFLKPTIEGDAPEYHIEMSGSDNSIVSPRMETTGVATPRVLLTGHATTFKAVRNCITGGYGSTNIVYTHNGITDGNGQLGPSRVALESIASYPLLALRSGFSGSNAQIIGFNTNGARAVSASPTSTDWMYRISGLNTEYKNTTDAFSKISISHSGGTIAWGTGTALADKGINGANTGLRVSSIVLPSVDNTYNFGNSALRWTELYATNGTINTSDARKKQDVQVVSDEVLDAWADVQYVQYRWIDSVQKKGDNARVHTGVLAQSIQAAFTARGLDAFKYGLLCYDKWEDEFGKDEDGNEVLVTPGGDSWGIRPDQCLFMEAALMRRELNRLRGN